MKRYFLFFPPGFNLLTSLPFSVQRLHQPDCADHNETRLDWGPHVRQNGRLRQLHSDPPDRCGRYQRNHKARWRQKAQGHGQRCSVSTEDYRPGVGPQSAATKNTRPEGSDKDDREVQDHEGSPGLVEAQVHGNDGRSGTVGAWKRNWKYNLHRGEDADWNVCVWFN